MHDQYGLDGQGAIVTGASRGIGRAIAERFAAEGVDVTICSRDEEEITAVAEEIADDYDADCLGVACDVRETESVAAMVEDTAAAFGGVDYLVNNAGASFMAGFSDISENGWESVVGVNLYGTVNCTRAAADHLQDGGGAVVNLASVAGQQGAPYMSHYGAAKAAVVNLTTTLASEWAGEDVRVNCVAPGYVATPGLESQMGISAEEIDREQVDRTVGVSAEIADTVQFLASDAASFLTGETIAPKGKPQIEETPET
jgi:NAD(P)-dependent dehydrogenase (short-subunit alcohol dehydrogenase family)